MEKQFVITISRQFGSGGRIIAQRLAQRLDIPFYDNELINLAAEKTGRSIDCFRDAESHAGLNLLAAFTSLAPNVDAIGLPMSEKVFLIQSQVIKEVVQAGSCIVVGRCADAILAQHDCCINLFLHAPLADRIACATRLYGVQERGAEAEVQKIDKRRAGYYYHFTGKKWGQAERYDMVLDTSKLSQDALLDVIEAYVKGRMAQNIVLEEEWQHSQGWRPAMHYQ